jgi:tRNA A37 threonylcarbamoyladenosine modification protein TsaB
LEAIAAAAPADIAQIAVAMDAQRGEVVAQSFARRPDGWFQPICQRQLWDIDAWLADVSPEMAIAGPALSKWGGKIPFNAVVIEPQHWLPRASAIARLAARDYAAGRRDDPWKLSPRYTRRSAAEEKFGL